MAKQFNREPVRVDVRKTLVGATRGARLVTMRPGWYSSGRGRRRAGMRRRSHQVHTKARRLRPRGAQPQLSIITRNMSSKTTPEQSYQKALAIMRRDRAAHSLALPYLQFAAAEGYAPAQYALATWLLHGTGARKSYAKAVALLKSASRKGCADAAYDLAICFEKGEGMAVSKSAAVRHYRRSVAAGSVLGLVELARCYYYGIGVRKNLSTAFRWYCKAATSGNIEAQYAAGYMLELGKGVEPDRRQALGWYRKAAKRGHAEAAKALLDLKTRARGKQ